MQDPAVLPAERISGEVSVLAREGWDDFVTDNRLTLSALLEALGRAFTEERPGAVDRWLNAVVQEAGSVMAERKKRRAG